MKTLYEKANFVLNKLYENKLQDDDEKNDEKNDEKKGIRVDHERSKKLFMLKKDLFDRLKEQ